MAFHSLFVAGNSLVLPREECDGPHKNKHNMYDDSFSLSLEFTEPPLSQSMSM